MNNEFIASATSTIKEVVSTMQARGTEYCDSWGSGSTWLLTKAILKKYANIEATDDICTAVGLSVFVDQKYSRLLGGYKKDTVLDLIPYIAALINKVEEESNKTS